MQTSISLVEEFQKENHIQMEHDEIELIARTIKQSSPDSLMVEWGSGASTIKWLQEMGNDQRLISIEHNEKWFAKVRPVIESSDDLARKAEYYFCKPSGYYRGVYGQIAEENPVGLDSYFAPNAKIFDGEIFLIDGVARGVCALMLLLRSRKPNPVIYLHDWYPRQPWYSWALGLFPRVERVGTTLVQLTKQP
jgi:hypothetical protein